MQALPPRAKILLSQWAPKDLGEWGGCELSWYLEALKKYAVFSGRSRRKEYWYFVLFVVIISIVLSIIDGLFGTYHRSTGAGLLSSIFSLAVLIPSIAVSV